MPTRPEPTEYATFYAKYVALVGDTNIVDFLRRNGSEYQAALGRIGEDRAGYRYAEDKWTIATLVGHVIDAERIFTYRALRIARGDATPLPSFDENTYAKNAGSDARSLADLSNELAAVRAGTLHLFGSFPEAAWLRSGVASNNPVTTRAIAWIAAGHAQHHLDILKERYGA